MISPILATIGLLRAIGRAAADPATRGLLALTGAVLAGGVLFTVVFSLIGIGLAASSVAAIAIVATESRRERRTQGAGGDVGGVADRPAR